MWTRAHRQRQAIIETRSKRYPTDLSEAEWLAIEPLLPGRAKTGRKRRIELREVLNAIRYLVRTGCGWRMLPAGLSMLEDGLLVVPALRARPAVPDHPRH